MDYEPKGRAKLGVDAMDADPDPGRIWSSEELSKIMGVPQSGVPANLLSALNNRRVYRRLNGSGKLEWRRIPFDAPAEVDVPRFSEQTVAAPDDRYETPTWVPKMTAPRPGSDVPAPSRGPGAPPAPNGVAAIAPLPLPPEPPAAAVPPALETEPEPDELPEPEAQEAPEEVSFDFCTWKDGGMQVWGAEQYEDGSFKLTSEQLFAIRRATAWMPPPREKVVS